MHVAVLFPSAVLTVIVAVPGLIAVTTPVCDTVATLGLSLDQVISLFVAFAGEIVAVKVDV